MRPLLLPALPILFLTVFLSGCGATREIVVPTVKLERVEIDPQLLQAPPFPAPPRHPDQRRRAAIAVELLGASLRACIVQIDQIRQQQQRVLATE